MIHADIIQHSVNPAGNSLITFQLAYPRFIHAQIMTHRVFSRNVSSSRAIPIKTMIKSVAENVAMPADWTKNQAGMKADELLDSDVAKEARIIWLSASAAAIQHAERLNELGLHKQHANRLLEPFMHVTTLLTATEFDNFFKLRLDEHAQPEIQELASQMKTCIDKSEPSEIDAGGWHVPYIYDNEYRLFPPTDLLAISAARCARISYKTHGANPIVDPNSDIKLTKRLMANGHWSPFEHQAMAIAAPLPIANFIGWLQYRHMLDRRDYKKITKEAQDSHQNA